MLLEVLIEKYPQQILVGSAIFPLLAKNLALTSRKLN